MHPPLIDAIGTGRRTSGEDHAWRSGFNVVEPAGDGQAAP